MLIEIKYENRERMVENQEECSPNTKKKISVEPSRHRHSSFDFTIPLLCCSESHSEGPPIPPPEWKVFITIICKKKKLMFSL